jgi:hypothetical protein
MSRSVTLASTGLVVALLAITPRAAPATQRSTPNAPEVFSCQAQGRTAMAGTAANFKIHIDRYTAEHDRTSMTDALKYGGYPAFVIALRKAPAIGRLAFGDQAFTVRWAREQSTQKGRTITVVTDTPVYFVGGGAVDAKPREGFELAVVQIALDEVGMGTGTMAAAARVKPDGKGGVLLEDYADEPIKLTFVRREIK